MLLSQHGGGTRGQRGRHGGGEERPIVCSQVWGAQRRRRLPRNFGALTTGSAGPWRSGSCRHRVAHGGSRELRVGCHTACLRYLLGGPVPSSPGDTWQYSEGTGHGVHHAPSSCPGRQRPAGGPSTQAAADPRGARSCAPFWPFSASQLPAPHKRHRNQNNLVVDPTLRWLAVWETWSSRRAPTPRTLMRHQSRATPRSRNWGHGG